MWQKRRYTYRFGATLQDCTLNGLGGSATQAGRRKRDLSEGVVFEKVRVNSQINVDLNSMSEGKIIYTIRITVFKSKPERKLQKKGKREKKKKSRNDI